MNKNDIISLIDQGENSAVEFKEDRIRPESLAREIVAFANMNGGIILLGVRDNCEIAGLNSDDFNHEEWCMNTARHNVIPSILISYSEYELDGKIVAAVTVPKGKDKPYQTTDAKFFLRVGSTNRIATINELMRLFQQSGVFHYDTAFVEKTGISNLDFTKLDKYFSRYELNFPEETEEEKRKILINTDIMCGNNYLTVAGLLIFGINPAKFLPQTGVSFAHFKGNEITSELIDKQNIDGTLDYIIDTTIAVIKNNIRIPSDIIGSKRFDRVTYSEKVYRELVVNACCHRNYSICGSKIRIFMFSNRIEFISPGKLPNTIDLEKIRYGVSYAVNPVILKFLENMRYIDRIGRGIPMVCSEAHKLGKVVTFEELGEEFKATLFF